MGNVAFCFFINSSFNYLGTLLTFKTKLIRTTNNLSTYRSKLKRIKTNYGDFGFGLFPFSLYFIIVLTGED